MKLQWNWGVGVGAVYAVFALATCGVVAFSMRTPVDLVSADYYAQAISLDAHRAAEARAAALGDALTIRPSDDGEWIQMTWPADLTIDDGTVRLYRPADAAADRSTPIAPGPDHRQSIALRDLAPGRWIVQLTWRSGGQSYYAERAITVASPRAKPQS